MANRPVTDTERQQVAELHAAGCSRNDIAAQLGRSGATISKIAAELDLSFDRTSVKAATAAKVADAKSRRAQLMHDYLDDAQRLRQQIWEPHEYIDHGGKDFTEARWTQNEPSPVDKLKLMQASTTALNGSIRLDLHDGDGSIEQVGSLLSSLFDSIRDRVGEDQAPDDDG